MMGSVAEMRASRRGALAGGLAGALALTGVGIAQAQDATPEANPAEADASPMFLFVQLAEGGSWLPSPGDPEVFILTLAGIGSHVAFFSDRPERIVGTVDTSRFLESLGFTPLNPPMPPPWCARQRGSGMC